MQNLVYAIIQAIHNLGAVTVVGVAMSALWLVRGNIPVQRRLAVLLAVVWAVQGLSGASFGLTTYYFEHHLPDIHGVAVDALVIKISCVLSGFILAVSYVKLHPGWSARGIILAWRASLLLGVVALVSAAFLRWFS